MNKQLIPTYKNQVLLFEFQHFKEYPEIVHGVFTRKGGFSLPPFHSLNIALDIGDAETSVIKNRSVVSDCLDHVDLVFLNQVHGADVIVHSSETDLAVSGKTQKGDSIISNSSNKGLVIQTADCQAVMLYDPVRKVVGNIHAGWRGSIQNIIGRTIHTMTITFGTIPKELIAGVGPSLGPCCAEFVNFKTEIPSEFYSYKDSRHYVDFWQISEDQLYAAGVLKENICISRLCTKCRTDLFYSYRHEKQTGRFASVIALKK